MSALIDRGETPDMWTDESEYVMEKPSTTTKLCDGTLLLSTANKELKFKKAIVEVGRDGDCDFIISHSVISRKHATFSYEEDEWYLCDNYSTNGTSINGLRIESGRKYQLTAYDEISFANEDKVVFCKGRSLSSQRAEKVAKTLAFLETGIKTFTKSKFKDEVAFKLILATLSEAPLYFPIEIDVASMFGTLDMTGLTHSDVTENEEDIRIKIRLATLDDGTELIPVFTSDEEAKKGGATSLIRYYPHDYLPIITKIGKSAIINPFGENRFLMTYKFIAEVLVPIVINKKQPSE